VDRREGASAAIAPDVCNCLHAVGALAAGSAGTLLHADLQRIVRIATGDRTRINQRFKVIRGGSWTRSLDSNLAPGYRLAADLNGHSDYETGFRVVLLRLN